MAVTAALIKELRELTGVGMSQCKEVLVETDGNIEKAVELLREKGLADAAKKAGRIAAEGLCKVVIDGNKGAIVEINSETDFVAKNQDFITYVDDVLVRVMNNGVETVEDFLASKWDDAQTIADVHASKVAVIGENLTIRRFANMTQNAGEVLVSYIHAGGKVAVLLKLKAENNDAVAQAGKNICMQIAAMSPKFVDRTEVSEEFIAKEREILTQLALNEGTKPEIVDKKVEGRLNKQLKEFCLVDQEYVQGDKQTVAQYLEEVSKAAGFAVTVDSFVRFETGEGIEKKEENFAEEVAKTMQG